MSNMVVQTNVMAINSHRNLGLVGNAQSRASARLSSGFRINSAADDAAGLAISEKMRAQIRGLDQASRNGQDGISLIQTAEGAMSIVNDMVIRIRELVVQASNDTNAHDSENLAQSDRIQIQREINALMDEIDDITLRTEFNTRTLLDGSLGGGVAGAGAGALTVVGQAEALAHVADFRAVVAEFVSHMFDTEEDGSVAELLDTLVGEGLSLEEANRIREDVISAVTRFESGVLAATSEREANAALNRLATEMNTITQGVINRNAADFIDGSGTIQSDFVALVEALGDFDSVTLVSGHIGPGAAGANVGMGTWHTVEAGNNAVAAVAARFGTAFEALHDAFTSLAGVSGLSHYQVAFNAVTGQPGPPTAETYARAEPLGTHALDWNESTVWSRANVGGGDGNALWFHIGANSMQGIQLSIEAVDVATLSAVGEGRTDLTVSQQTTENVLDGFYFAALRNSGLDTGSGIMLEEGIEINRFIDAIDAALAHVAGQRANLGATQNRLEFTIENLDIASENLSAANSRIRDADMAQEMMRFTQSNVLQQAAISMLAQANQGPQNILQLLR